MSDGTVRLAFDTVEEFWGAEDLQHAYDLATVSRADLIDCFELHFVKYLGSRGVGLFVPSGRAALRIALGMLKTQGRRNVLVPAFCCRFVGEAIVQAGMRPLLIDSGATVGSIDWNACDAVIRRGDVAAVVVPHLFGLPLDIRPLLEQAQHYGAVVIEDCAHCLGGRVGGTPAGAFGDFSIFSFNYDKPISLGGGGMLVCNPSSLLDRRALESERAVQRAAIPTPSAERKELEDFRNWLAVRRGTNSPPGRLYRLSRKIPGNLYIRWLADRLVRRNGQENGFILPVSVGYVRAALGLALLEQYPEVLARRIQNHDYLADQIKDRNVGEMMRPPAFISPAWLKAKLTIQEAKKEKVDALEQFLCSKGFRAGRFNWARTTDQEVSVAFKARRIGCLRNAHRMAQLSIDLPIHQNMEFSDLKRMASYVIEWLA